MITDIQSSWWLIALGVGFILTLGIAVFLVMQKIQNLSQGLQNKMYDVGLQSQSTLGDLKARLALIDRAQQDMVDLSKNVLRLQDILSNKQARGAFGEIQLHDLVKAILPPSAYQWQAVLDNNRRVDCLITLPNPPGPIGVDAKFPLEAYHALQQAEDQQAKAIALRQFAQAVLLHLKVIQEKYIIPGFTADTALMFIPSETIYAAIHEHLPDVVMKSYQLKVYMVSPTTLWATLNTVRAIFRDVQMREQAHWIQKEVRMLQQDVERLDDRVGKVQRHFEQTSDDLRQIRLSTEKITKRSQRIDQGEENAVSLERYSSESDQRAYGT